MLHINASTLEKCLRPIIRRFTSACMISSLSIYLIQTDISSPAHSHRRVRANVLPILRKFAVKRVYEVNDTFYYNQYRIASKVEKIFGSEGIFPANHFILYPVYIHFKSPLPPKEFKCCLFHSLSVISKYFFPNASISKMHTKPLTVDLGTDIKV